MFNIKARKPGSVIKHEIQLYNYIKFLKRYTNKFLDYEDNKSQEVIYKK